eukprot:s2513_g5.t1
MLWASAAKECRIFAGILPLLVGDLRKPWSNTILCSDASPVGFGLVERELEGNKVQSIGAWNERWRYKRLPPDQWRPRQRAVPGDVFSDQWTARRPDPLQESGLEYCENSSFPEVPPNVLDPKDWKTAKIGIWNDQKQHITLKEGKAFILGVRRITRNSRLRGHKILYLVDNLALALAISKGRAHDFGMLRICQQYAALSLASNVFVRVRWVPSEFNPADGPSRGSLQPCSAWDKYFKAEDSAGPPKAAEAGHDEELEVAARAARCLRARKAAGMAEGFLEEEETKMSMLEAASVGAAQRRQYQSYLRTFKDFCLEHGQEWPPECLDVILADFCDELYLSGQSVATGEKTVAAVEFHFIEQKGKLQRAKRALRGWRKTTPPLSRLPLPRLAAMGMGMVMLANNQRDMCLKLLLDFDAYLRPAEGMDLLGEHIVPPVPGAGPQFVKYAVIIRDQDQGKPDKTGIYDNTIHLDNPMNSGWLGPALHKLAKRNGMKRPLFSFKADDFRKQYVKAGEQIGLKGLQTYQLRHGGASDDLNCKARDFQAVRERGRWRTDSSVRRYAKTGKIQKLLQEMSVHHLEFCRWAQSNMQKVLLGKVPPRTP